MSVYTELTHTDIASILSSYNLGTLHHFEGIAAGIENSNFFIDTEKGRFVLTIFERLDASELPYFMRLMRHLSSKGLSCPDVMVRDDTSLLFSFMHEGVEKCGCIVSYLSGKTLDTLNEAQLYASGKALAQLHLAGQDFNEQRDNPTDTHWLQHMIETVSERCEQVYGADVVLLLQDELKQQQAYHLGSLPVGVIHGDLFVDNILFDGERVAGLIDFYYAHSAPWMMDVAISLNAQAVILGENDSQRMQTFLRGYSTVRNISPQENASLSMLLRMSALRFWTSRLYDALFPREGAITQVKDPKEYENKLKFHRESSS
ncbi:MAG: homoserine kinase [Mariprofundaceae bacterium]|nr:homoserine kinase [Mariprofundaceae bacterium]